MQQKKAQPVAIIGEGNIRWVVRSDKEAMEAIGVSKKLINQWLYTRKQYLYHDEKTGKDYTLFNLPKEDFNGAVSEESIEFLKRGNQEKAKNQSQMTTWHKECICWKCSKSSRGGCSWVNELKPPAGAKVEDFQKKGKLNKNTNITIVECPEFSTEPIPVKYDTEGCLRVLEAICRCASEDMETLAKMAVKARGLHDWRSYESAITSLQFEAKFYEGSDYGESFLNHLRGKYKIEF